MRRRKLRPQRLPMLGQTTAQERPRTPREDRECIEVGGEFSDPTAPPAYRFGPYRVCLTKKQRAKLFKNRPIREIGCGTFACAYDHPNPNRIVKITRDEQDVGGLLRARGTKLVPEVYEAYELRDGGRSLIDGRKTHVFAVVADRLRPLSDEERRSLAPFVDALGYGVSGLATARQTCCDPYDPKSCNEICLDVFQVGRKLHARGIDWIDTHGGNVGYDQEGRMRVLDVGRSEVMPPALEALAGRRARRGRQMVWRRRRR